MRELITLIEEKSKQDIGIVELSYGEAALDPTMSKDTIKLHWVKLAHAYAERFNRGEGDLDFNYAGAMLHNIFFAQFREGRNKNEPNGPIGNLIKQKFKNFSNFCDEFTTKAMSIQGSGWCYFSRSGEIKTIHNHSMRSDILILIDMWEHAYILDYGSDKKKYLENIWKIVDWNKINSVWGQAYKR